MSGLYVSVELVEHTCWSCGIVYGLPDNYDRQRREKGGSWFCPNGHGSVFNNPEMKVLRESLQRAQQEAINERARADSAEKATRRIQKRIAAGTCPNCHRHFVNVERHMKSKHTPVSSTES